MTRRSSAPRLAGPGRGRPHLSRLLPWLTAAVGALGALGLLGGSTAQAATSAGYQVLAGDGVSGVVFVTPAGSTSSTAIPPPGSVSGGVASLAISPDGSRVYVAFKDGMLGTIDTATESYLGAPIQLGANAEPGPMVVTPNGQDIYIAEAGPVQLVELNTATDAVVGLPISAGGALNLAITPDGSTLFVDSGVTGSSISLIATASNTVSSTAIAVASPGEMLMSSDGTHLYVLTDPPSGPALVVIDPLTDAVQGSPVAFPSTIVPTGFALSPDGQELYLIDARSQLMEGFATATATFGPTPFGLPAGLSPRDVAVSPDGGTALVDGTDPAGNSELSSIALSSGASGQPVILTGATQPTGLVIAPAAPTPTPIPPPLPTPTPRPTCSPIVVGPFPGGLAQSGLPTSSSTSRPTSSPGAPVSGAAFTPSSVPPTGVLPTAPPLPGGPPSIIPYPIMCFGAAAGLPGGHRLDPKASLARAAAAQAGPGTLLLPGALAVLGLVAAGGALAVRSFGLRLPRIPRPWRG